MAASWAAGVFVELLPGLRDREAPQTDPPLWGKLLLRAGMGFCAYASHFSLSVFGEVVTWAGRTER